MTYSWPPVVPTEVKRPEITMQTDNIGNEAGHSDLSTMKYQFSYDHWNQATLSLVSTWMGDCSRDAWVLLLTLLSRLELISRPILVVGSVLIHGTLGTTCRRCQARLEILVGLPTWPLEGHQDEQKKKKRKQLYVLQWSVVRTFDLNSIGVSYNVW